MVVDLVKDGFTPAFIAQSRLPHLMRLALRAERSRVRDQQRMAASIAAAISSEGYAALTALHAREPAGAFAQNGAPRDAPPDAPAMSPEESMALAMQGITDPPLAAETNDAREH